MEPIISRLAIAERAYADAVLTAAGQAVANPYPPNSDAAALWSMTMDRYLNDQLTKATA